MAKPGLEEGYLRYAHTLDAALAYADFGKAERVVLREVFAQIFGPAQRKFARLRPGKLARMTTLSRPNASRAIRNLVAFDVLHRRSEFRYRFIKNYESWMAVRRGKLVPRFAAEELQAIAKAGAHARYYRHEQEGRPVSRETTNVVYPDTPPRVWIDNETLSVETTNVVYPDTPILRQETGDKTATLLPDVSVSTTREPSVDVGDDAWSHLSSRLFPDDHDLGFALGAFASRYAPEWVEAAAWCAFANGVGRPRPYINACLSRWKARGGIPTDEAAAAESARSASAGPRDKGARIDDALARIMARQEAQP